ncbi:hypothetical protein SLEP1_g51904 [Rubroshorea leprosula]|uniref:Uncharacterized protein n=1 Tax=Rubroshorea leprosula TaxID=152421 RepID=A0AAV5M5G6_9ROSI|nr:hypothetical protein SLEP1_g51904 [Rubroshorea leprosula]
MKQITIERKRSGIESFWKREESTQRGFETDSFQSNDNVITLLIVLYGTGKCVSDSSSALLSLLK